VTTAPRKRLGEMLLESGVIDLAQLQSALGHQRRWGGRLGQALVDLKIASEAQIVDMLSRKLGYGSIRLAALEHGPALELALRLVPYEFAARNRLLPYAADTGTIWVAMSDPTNVAVVDVVAFRTGRRVKISIAGDHEIAEAARRLYLQEKRGVEAIALSEEPTGPVEMVGNFEGGSIQALDAFFSKAPRRPPAPAPPAPEAAAAAAGAAPANRPTQAIPNADAEARLAEAVRRLKLEDETTASRGMAERDPRAAPPAKLPAAPPPPPREAPPPKADAPASAPKAPPEPEAPDSPPRLLALLDALDRAARVSQAPPEVARVARLSSALVRVLLRKGVLTEAEVLGELLRKGPPG